MDILCKKNGHECIIRDANLFTGVTDQNGVKIFEGDLVDVYIPSLDENRLGTVEYSTADKHPCWLVRLEKPYEHKHALSALHGIPSYTTNAHYLDGGCCRVVSREDAKCVTDEEKEEGSHAAEKH